MQRGKDSLFLDRDNRDKWERKAGGQGTGSSLGTTTSSGRSIQPQGIRRQARSGPDMVACSSLRTANSGRHMAGRAWLRRVTWKTGSTNTETFQCRTRSGC